MLLGVSTQTGSFQQPSLVFLFRHFLSLLQVCSTDQRRGQRWASFCSGLSAVMISRCRWWRPPASTSSDSWKAWRKKKEKEMMSSASIGDKSARQRRVTGEHGGGGLSHRGPIHHASVGGTGARARVRRARDGDQPETGITLSPLSPSHIWRLNSGGVRLFMMRWLALIYTAQPQINTNHHFLWPALINISTRGRSRQRTSKHLWFSTWCRKCADEAATYVLTWFCVDESLWNIYIHPVAVNLWKLLNKAPNKRLRSFGHFWVFLKSDSWRCYYKHSLVFPGFSWLLWCRCAVLELVETTVIYDTVKPSIYALLCCWIID